MSARMQYPLSQRRHTNIAVVRYQKNGVRLEIACYKNKVTSYRAGTEDRLDEVLQVDRVFSNVGRGYVASNEDIAAVFGPDMSEEEAIKFMLIHGELQVAQQERTAEVDEIFKDVALIISQKCVNVKTQRPFPTVVIEQALKSIGAAVKLDQPVKKQALGLIHQLIESQIIPIARANMKVRCLCPREDGVATLDEWCAQHDAQVLERKTAMVGGEGSGTTQHSRLVLIQPNLFRELDTFVKDTLPAGSSIHVVDAAAMESGEGDVSLLTRSADGAVPVAGGGSLGRTDGASSSHTGRAPGRGRADGSDSDGDDSDEGGGGGGGRRGGKAGKKKGQPTRGRRGKTASSLADDLGDEFGNSGRDEDSDGDGGRRGGGKNKKQSKQKAAKEKAAPAVAGSGALTAELVRLGLDPANDFDNDSGDDAGRGKGKKGKGRGKAGKKAQGGGGGGAQPAAKKDEEAAEEDDSDEELMVNRRQRKKQTVNKDAAAHYNTGAGASDEDFDYGDEEDA